VNAKKTPAPLSPSRAKDFMQCPRLYYYKTILGIRTPPTEATLRGTIAHYAFEHVFNHPLEERTLETALAYVDPAWSLLIDPLKERTLVEVDSAEFRLRSAEGRFRDLVEPGSDAETKLLEETATIIGIVNGDTVPGFLESIRRTVAGWFSMENPQKFTPRDRELYVRAQVGPALVHGFIDRLDAIVDRSGVERFFVSDYKGLALDTPLPTPTGWTTMGRVTVGDELLAPSGAIVRVVEKTPTQRLDCFEVRLEDKSSVVADAVHLWTLADGRVVSTLELRSLLLSGVPVALPAAAAVELAEEELPLPAHLAGSVGATTELLHPLSLEYMTLLRATRGSIAQRLELLDGVRSVSEPGLLTVQDEAICGLLAECAALCGLGYPVFRRRDDGFSAVFDPQAAPSPRAVASVEPVVGVDTACVRVDSVDHTYLCGRGLLPTHNTGRKPSERFADDAFFHLEVYAAALAAAEGIETHQLRLVYTSEANPKGVLTRTVTPATLERTKAKIRSVWEGIRRAEESGNWPTRKQRLCDWCHFQSVCPAFHPELEGLLPEEVELRLSRPDEE
jgi:RecB family exonuclease